MSSNSNCDISEKNMDRGDRHLEFWEMTKVAQITSKLVMLSSHYRTYSCEKKSVELAFPGQLVNYQFCLLARPCDYFPWSVIYGKQVTDNIYFLSWMAVEVTKLYFSKKFWKYMLEGRWNTFIYNYTLQIWMVSWITPLFVRLSPFDGVLNIKIYCQDITLWENITVMHHSVLNSLI